MWITKYITHPQISSINNLSINHQSNFPVYERYIYIIIYYGGEPSQHAIFSMSSYPNVQMIDSIPASIPQREQHWSVYSARMEQPFASKYCRYVWFLSQVRDSRIIHERILLEPSSSITRIFGNANSFNHILYICVCDMYNIKIIYKYNIYIYIYINLHHLTSSILLDCTSFPSFRGIPRVVQVYHIALHGGIAACQMGIGNQLMGLPSGCLT